MGEQQMACRGIRGAITVDGDGTDAVRSATATLIDTLIRANDCALEDVAAAIFTVPDDLAGSNPALVAREMGWSSVPLLLVKDEGGDIPIRRCLRVLVLWNTTRSQEEIRHVYLGGAAALRPDLAGAGLEGGEAW